jgi:DNA-binding NtrC family response regulator
MSKKRVLVADDEPSVLEITGRMLAHLGYVVELCSDSRKALNCFMSESESIDLVISDISMPGMKGDELAERMLGIRPKTPIILCSGYDGSEEIAAAGAKGVYTILSKPIRLKELEAAVEGALAPQPVHPGHGQHGGIR